MYAKVKYAYVTGMTASLQVYEYIFLIIDRSTPPSAPVLKKQNKSF